jgi:ATP-dependent Zn protease
LNEETNRIFQEAAKEVEELLKRERVILDRFAHELLKREELEYDDIEAIFTEYGKSRAQLAALEKQTVKGQRQGQGG